MSAVVGVSRHMRIILGVPHGKKVDKHWVKTSGLESDSRNILSDTADDANEEFSIHPDIFKVPL